MLFSLVGNRMNPHNENKHSESAQYYCGKNQLGTIQRGEEGW